MRFRLTVKMDGAAFEENSLDELARILREMADLMDWGAQQTGTVRDMNGNTCGDYCFSADPNDPDDRD